MYVCMYVCMHKINKNTHGYSYECELSICFSLPKPYLISIIIIVLKVIHFSLRHLQNTNRKQKYLKIFMHPYKTHSHP